MHPIARQMHLHTSTVQIAAAGESLLCDNDRIE